MNPKIKVIIGISAIALITIILVGLVVYTQKKTAYYNPFNGKTILNNVYEPDKTRTSAPNQNLVLDHVQLVTPEEKVGENITAEDTYKVEIAVQGDVSRTTLQTLYDNLQTVPPIYTKVAPIVFQVAFTVKATK